MDSFPEILTQGGDDRLLLNRKTGVNKYFVKPEVAVGCAFRGSCTCNSPSEEGYAAAEEAYNNLYNYDELLPNDNYSETTEALMDEIRQRLIKAYGMPEGTGVFFTPSGSDAEYIPLLIVHTKYNKARAL